MVTIAETIAERFGNDGQRFVLDGGEPLRDVCRHAGARVVYGRNVYNLNTERDLISEVYPENTSETLVRYLFPDGSAIVVAGEGWDVEGMEPWSWEGD